MVAVHDGDTLSVRTATAVVRVRLAGIDCPEQGQRFSRRARQFTASLAAGRAVQVLGQGRDQYDRLLGRVLVDGRDLNEALVRAGFAWHYVNGAPGEVLAAAEREARAARRGLWSDPDPIPPWAWRRTHARDGQPRQPARATPANPSGPAGPLRGNTRSRVFHRPECPNYRCRNCTEQFLTEASALEAGYRPAGDCHRR